MYIPYNYRQLKLTAILRLLDWIGSLVNATVSFNYFIK